MTFHHHFLYCFVWLFHLYCCCRSSRFSHPIFLSLIQNRVYKIRVIMVMIEQNKNKWVELLLWLCSSIRTETINITMMNNSTRTPCVVNINRTNAGLEPLPNAFAIKRWSCLSCIIPGTCIYRLIRVIVVGLKWRGERNLCLCLCLRPDDPTRLPRTQTIIINETWLMNHLLSPFD